jgi:hypothetical protein
MREGKTRRWSEKFEILFRGKKNEICFERIDMYFGEWLGTVNVEWGVG